MENTKESSCELAVIGTGMAGMAAAISAVKRGIKTAQIGVSGGILYASGFLDLMGVHPVTERKIWASPWAAIESLARDIPGHPYARMRAADIGEAMEDFMAFFDVAGLPYQRIPDGNTEVITPAGTLKPTYGVPASMWGGVAGRKENRPCLIVDFWGLKGFSAIQITEMLSHQWPNLRPVRIAFPVIGPSVDLYPEQMARLLELEDNRVRLADEIRPHLNGAQAVGLPAILGIYHTGTILAHLKSLLGTDVFEIPTIPPSVPGLRIQEAYTDRITKSGVQLFLQKRVRSAHREPDGRFVLHIGGMASEEIHHLLFADRVILATGRFLGMGLHAGRKKITEPLFGLPVNQPEERSLWHERDFFSPAGHRINRAGIEIDARFRPVVQSGQPAYENLYAAGSILAHQDWMREKCGAGLAIATAYAAVRSSCSA